MTRALSTLALAACTTARPAGPPDAASGSVAVKPETAVVRQGLIGSLERSPGTYVFVDVDNQTTSDRLVVVEGDLLDAAGAPAGRLVAAELRVPAGGSRAFALVADQHTPAARSARLRATRAVPVSYPEPIVITGVELQHVGGLSVATGSAENQLDREGSATFVAAFYDGAGHILARPFVVVGLGKRGDAGGRRALRFEGPPEAERAVLFVGESVF